MLNMTEFLRYMVVRGASDLHLMAGRRPHLRIYGELQEAAIDMDILKPDDVKNAIYSLLNSNQMKEMEANKELDFAYMLTDLCRFRINVYSQRGSLAVAVRAIPFCVKSLEELLIPSALKMFVNQMHGLILVTGPQGSGKTTTLASLIDYINSTRKVHIITIEDPIEYVHKSKKSLVNQREIGRDTDSYGAAMKYILRQDLDVCLIGEMRDCDSVKTALSLAEAGILVLSTVHSSSAPEAISRIVDMFNPEYQLPVRTQLAITLSAIVSQQLVPCKDGKGRILACEVMKKTAPIEYMIKNYNLKQIESVMLTSKENDMWTIDQYLFELYSHDKITKYELFRRVANLNIVKQWADDLDEIRNM